MNIALQIMLAMAVGVIMIVGAAVSGAGLYILVQLLLASIRNYRRMKDGE